MLKRYFNPVHLIIMLSLISGISSKAQVFDVVVDKNGHGDFTSVQAAINSVPGSLQTRTLIYVKNGIYNEKVVLSPTKTNLSLIGEDEKKIIISWDDNPQKGIPAADTYTFWADGPGFYAENITIRNTSGNVGQALAIKTTGDTMVFKNCRFIGFQDTYYANKRRQYNLKCYIEGATDFIYGDATTVFDSCTINCVKGGQYISAPADTKLITPLVGGRFLHGLLFRYCNVTANDDVADNSYFLGRPWQPNSSSVFMNCTLGSHIKSEGWSVWSGNTNHESAYFAEYQNLNPDGSPADISGRVSWSNQVSDLWATNLYNLNFFLKSNNLVWDPVRVTKELAAPGNFKAEGNQLTWAAVPDAIGYVVLKNDSTIGFAVSTTFTDNSYQTGHQNYAVKSVSVNGALSKSSGDEATSSEIILNKKPGIVVLVRNNNLSFSEEVTYQLYSISGILLHSGKGLNTNLNGIKNGIYLVKTISSNGKTNLTKIVFNN
jgi:pectin methylesterase-like acyl-CoA thioesterase